MLLFVSFQGAGHSAEDDLECCVTILPESSMDDGSIARILPQQLSVSIVV